MKKRILSLLLAFIMVVSMVPAPVFSVETETTGETTVTSPDHSGDVGKYVKLNESIQNFTVYGLTPTGTYDTQTFLHDDFQLGTIFRISDWMLKDEQLWYQLTFYKGGTQGDFAAAFPAEPWFNQTEAGELIFLDTCSVCGKPDCTVNHTWCDICEKYDCGVVHETTPPDVTCPICGETGCTVDHIWCEICQADCCGKTHLYCNVCQIYDCDKTHVWCGTCGGYDCGQVHEDVYKPITAPVIPEYPAMSDGADVSVVDENGDIVTEEGYFLISGTKASLSAWPALEGEASYQWQICYDSENDLWADIQGQTGKGILLSPAMILSIAGDQGSAMVRCAVTVGGETQTSEAIPVTVLEPVSLFSMSTASNTEAQADTVDPGDLEKAYVVVQYVYSDGRTAASTAFMEIVPGEAFTHSVDVPEIPGYKATIELASHKYGGYVTMENGNLSMAFPEGVLTEPYTIFTVTYVPDYVNYTVIHYWQNVGDDHYTEHERETISNQYKTGEVISEAHKTYEGFYHLLYETPAAAADGSTVIEVYYDRYYYLMTFELGEMGYGVEPVYARYGSPIEIGTPTRAGYTFQGWTLNGSSATVPGTMPVGGGSYKAQWIAEETEYTVAYWIQNDDGTKTYVGSKIVGAMSGSLVSGSDDLNIETNVCGMLEHSHDSCTMLCVLKEHTHGDGKCLYNCGITYHDHTSGCNYTCGQDGCIAHTRECYEFSDATVSADPINVYYISAEDTINGFTIYYYYSYNDQGYCIQINNNYYEISYDKNTSLEYTLNCHVHSDACCSVAYHDHSGCVCNVVPHKHGAGCYSCGTLAHTHTEDCKSDLAKYVDFVEADKNVTVEGNGSTVVNVLYKYRRYTIRFLYARQNATGGNSYQIATVTGNGNLETGYNQGGPYWVNVSSLPEVVIDPNEQPERSTVTIGNYTYYYISLTAQFGENISAIWPSANIGATGNYEWGSWAAEYGTGYRVKYGDKHANIVGPYPTMSADMIVDDPELLEDGTYLAQNMIAWWAGTGDKVEKHAYHNYFEVLPSQIDDPGVVEYEGKFYKLVETYTFTAAHNGTTRVDPIYFNGFKCINDTRDTNNDTQENSNNFANKGACEICGDNCDYCNTFYYDRNVHKLYFWNYNGHLTDGRGSDVPYGASLHLHGDYVSADKMKDYYPDGLEPGAYEFAGWYTTADCLDGTEMDWNMTMPDSDMTVYAKWVPVSRTVNFYLTRDSLTRGETIPEEMARLVAAADVRPETDPYSTVFAGKTLQHGSYIGELNAPGVYDGYENIHPRAGYDFVGWFYINENGEETAFDPENMPVTQDLNLYAKWSSNKLCQYNVYFALDSNNDGVPDTDASGSVIYVADPVTGSGIAGRTYTFAAKGGEDLYDTYRDGYFPTVGSHSIVIDIADENGTGANSYIFLYQEKLVAPYTVRYLDKATGQPVVVDGVSVADKVVEDNKNIVVTENFVYIQGYMPDAYQQTLVVTAEGPNVITFWYTADTQHALYVVNYYIELLDPDLKHAGWVKYTDLQYTGDIGKAYSASAISIDGFTLSKEYTDLYNDDNINGMTEAALPAAVGALTDGKLTGTLTDKGMELNFYYTRNLYPYEFRFMLNGTTTELADPEFGMAAYDSIVSMGAKEIQMDLDGDGILEDYRLYDPKEATKDIHIKMDGDPLNANASVTEGQATVNVATFYYVRCTQDMTIIKEVVDKGTDTHPDSNQEFTIQLLIHAQSGYHQSSYAFKKSDGTTGTLTPILNTLEFKLKAGESITIQGLPTAEYTVSELNLPTGYYDTYAPAKRNKLTVDSQLTVTVTNTYDPAVLEISKTVDVVENDNNTPEVEKFEFTITVPTGVTGNFTYKVANVAHTAVVTDGKMTVSLEKGQTARFVNLPLGSYTVEETDYSAQGYKSNYSVNGAAYTEGRETSVTLSRGTVQKVDFKNKFPVGDLIIEKTVIKEFYATPWSGDTFTFTVSRTSKALISGNTYNVEVDGVPAGPAVVLENGTIQVTITFDTEDAGKLTEKDAEVQHTLVIKNLPAGTYEVTETPDAAYVQTPSGLKVGNLVIPSDTSAVAAFTNMLIRPTGSLYLEKMLEILPGYNPEEPPEKFSFTVELTEQPPAGNLTINLSYSNGTTSTVTMTDGKFTVTLEPNQYVTMSGLPIGNYRITEATIPSYANSFAHKIDREWVLQEPTSTEDGRMYTDIQVPVNDTAEVLCTNTYPVDRAELIIQKLVTKAYDRDTLPDDIFTFTVILSVDDLESYEYTVYGPGNAEGIKDTAKVTDRSFTIQLKAGQYAVISEMPVCEYTVKENASNDYDATYNVYQAVMGDAPSTTANTSGNVIQSGAGTGIARTFSAGKTDTVVFTNQYKKHLGQLTITKTVEGTPAETDTFIFHITGNGIDMDVSITGSGSVTIYDLPLGSYTVTEDTAWNWRYTAKSGTANATMAVDAASATVNFTNTYKEENPWLNFVTNILNIFTKEGGTGENE